MTQQPPQVRRVLAEHWQQAVTVAGSLASAAKILGDWFRRGGISPQGWTFATITCALLLLIRFPRIAVVFTRLLLGPSFASADSPRLFRGLLSYQNGDELPGRTAEAQDCARLIGAFRFVVIDGEVGAGKSSLINAALIPMLSAQFRVRLIVLQRDDIGSFTALTDALKPEPPSRSKGRVSSTPTILQLLIIDQFENLFALAKDSDRASLMRAILQAVSQGSHVLIGIRSDYTDLLLKLIRDEDASFATLNVGNIYPLTSFSSEKSAFVVRALCAPLADNDPILVQQIRDFAKALTDDLLRAPRDTRLNAGDVPTVLPAELQIVGITLERIGTRYLSAEGLTAAGGKAGLLMKYIQEATLYVFRRTAVDHRGSLLVLRQLITPGHAKCERTATEISNHSNLSASQIESVLAAFSEISITKKVPRRPEQTGENSYELIHDHLISVLLDTPDPILIKARDAEERLRFWHAREDTRRATIASFASQGHLRKSRARELAGMFHQSIPITEIVSLRRFAVLPRDRALVNQSIRAISAKVMLVVVPLLGFWMLMLTPHYQAWQSAREAPYSLVAGEANVDEDTRKNGYGDDAWVNGTGEFDALRDWARAAAAAGFTTRAMSAAQSVADPYLRARILLTVAQQCNVDQHQRCFRESLERARDNLPLIENAPLRLVATGHMAAALRKAHDKNAEAIAARVMEQAQGQLQKESRLTPVSAAFAETAALIYDAGDKDRARQLWDMGWFSALGSRDVFARSGVVEVVSSASHSGDREEVDKLLSALSTTPMSDFDQPFDPRDGLLVELADSGDTLGLHKVIDMMYKSRPFDSTSFATAVFAVSAVHDDYRLEDSLKEASVDTLFSSQSVAPLMLAGQENAASSIAAAKKSPVDERPFTDLVALVFDTLSERTDSGIKILSALKVESRLFEGQLVNVQLAAQASRAGKLQEALTLVKDMPQGHMRSIGTFMAISGMSEYLRRGISLTNESEVPKELAGLEAAAQEIGEHDLKSMALGQVGLTYAVAGRFQQATRIAASCLPVDKLRISTALLGVYSHTALHIKAPDVVFADSPRYGPTITLGFNLSSKLRNAQSMVERVLWLRQ
jgi:hypothetical protein